MLVRPQLNTLNRKTEPQDSEVTVHEATENEGSAITAHIFLEPFWA